MPTLTLQPGPSDGFDTYLDEGAPGTPHATSLFLLISNQSAGRANGADKFDLSPIPSNATIISATLSLWNLQAVAGAATVNLYRILSANSGWIEGATWNFANPSTLRWAGDTGHDGGADAGCSVSGTDYNASSLGSFTWANNDPADTQYNITLSVSGMQSMLASNNGFVFVGGDSSRSRAVRSSNYVTDPTKRPRLVIVYSLPSGRVGIKSGGAISNIGLQTGGQL